MLKTITVERFYRHDGGHGNPQFAVRMWRDEKTTGLGARMIRERWLDHEQVAKDYALDLSRCYGGMIRP